MLTPVQIVRTVWSLEGQMNCQDNSFGVRLPDSWEWNGECGVHRPQSHQERNHRCALFLRTKPEHQVPVGSRTSLPSSAPLGLGYWRICFWRPSLRDGPGTAFLVRNRMQNLTAEIPSRDTASRRKRAESIGRMGKSVKLSPKTCKAQAIIKSSILLRGTVNSIICRRLKVLSCRCTLITHVDQSSTHMQMQMCGMNVPQMFWTGQIFCHSNTAWMIKLGLFWLRKQNAQTC